MWTMISTPLGIGSIVHISGGTTDGMTGTVVELPSGTCGTAMCYSIDLGHPYGIRTEVPSDVHPITGR